MSVNLSVPNPLFIGIAGLPLQDFARIRMCILQDFARKLEDSAMPFRAFSSTFATDNLLTQETMKVYFLHDTFVRRLSLLAMMMIVGITTATSKTAALTDTDSTETDVPYLRVNGTIVTEDNASDVLGDGTVSFAYTNNTLYLNNADINNITSTLADLTIELNGKNRIGEIRDYEFGAIMSGSFEEVEPVDTANMDNLANLTIIGANGYDTDTLYIGIFNTVIFANKTNFTIKNCYFINRQTEMGIMGKGGVFTVDNAYADIFGNNVPPIKGFDKIEMKGVVLLSPAGGFIENGMVYKADSTIEWWNVIIGPPNVIEPVTVVSDTTIAVINTGSFVDDSSPEGQKSLVNTVIGNVYYNIDNSYGTWSDQGYYDSSDQSIVVNATTETATVATVASSEDPLTAAAAKGYVGIIYEIPAGQGQIIVDALTSAANDVAIQVGTDEAVTYASTDAAGETTVNYNVAGNTFVYVYATAASSSGAKGNGVRKAPPLSTGVKIYSIKTHTNIATGIRSISTAGDVTGNATDWYSINGQRISGKPNRKGLYINGGKKLIVK
jgi:hypothetical protein